MCSKISQHVCFCREALLSHITTGDDVEVLGALSVLATLLQTEGQINAVIQLPSLRYSFLIMHPISVELDESMLDALGILPQRKQHKKLLLVLFHDIQYCNFWTLSIDSMCWSFSIMFSSGLILFSWLISTNIIEHFSNGQYVKKKKVCLPGISIF